MIEPMLAVTLDKVKIDRWSDWAIEEKFDGHRIVVAVRLLDGKTQVDAWSRPREHAGQAGKSMATRSLPENLVAAFRAMPPGIYDGELLGGETSTDVTRTDLREGGLRFVVFDLMETLGRSTMLLPYEGRRETLEFIFSQVKQTGITLAEARGIVDKGDVIRFVDEIWKRGGEGAMLKRKAATYQPGKRSKDVVKVKKIDHEVMKIIGFQAGKGTKIDRGQFAMVVVQSQDGKRTTSVKTLDDAELAAFAKHPLTNPRPLGLKEFPKAVTGEHPAIGRLLQIEFNGWTPKAGYRHPRWDHWDNE